VSRASFSSSLSPLQVIQSKLYSNSSSILQAFIHNYQKVSSKYIIKLLILLQVLVSQKEERESTERVDTYTQQRQRECHNQQQQRRKQQRRQQTHQQRAPPTTTAPQRANEAGMTRMT
jgi:hypothetical protein